MPREKVLLSGEFNTSKTLSLITLAIFYPDSQIIIFDPDDGVAKTRDELGVELPNLMLIPYFRKQWKEFEENYSNVKNIAGAGDWVCFDMIGRFWDESQDYYGEFVYGESPLNRLMQQRRQAQSIQFGGFDGLQDWTLIKRLHNDIIDDAVVSSTFNVMATTSVKEYLPVERVPRTGLASIYAQEFGIKPEGEKHNIYRFDTQVVLYRKPDNTYHFRLVRDRGRTVNVQLEFDITNRNFWEVYAEYRGIRL